MDLRTYMPCLYPGAIARLDFICRLPASFRFDRRLRLIPERRAMTLLHLHHDDARSLGGAERLPFRHAFKWIRNAFSALHQAILTAKLRRLRSELLFRHDYSEMMPPPEQDAAKFPQRPLVLGDKWDF